MLRMVKGTPPIRDAGSCRRRASPRRQRNLLTWVLPALGLFAKAPGGAGGLGRQQSKLASMLNDENELVDLYLPRKCSWTNKLITSKDHGAVQINIGHLNEEGVYITGQFSTFALVGAVRAQGEGDSAIDLLWQKRRQEVGQ